MQQKTLNSIKGYVGLARKGNYLIIGNDNLKGYYKKLYLILRSNDAGKNLVKVTNYTSEQTSCQIFEIEKEIMQEITGIENCKAFGVKNKGLADQIINLLRGETIWLL